MEPAGRPRIDASVAHSARVHDYWLGGKDNFAADRAAGEAVQAAYPGIVQSVRANRAFLARVVWFLAAEAGITQFLDIGTGIPAPDNTHEVAQSVARGARVVYVDYDPVVLQHARALLTSGPRGTVDYLQAATSRCPRWRRTSSPSGWPRRPGSTTRGHARRSGTARTPRWPGSSTALSCSSQAWWWCRNGAPSPGQRPKHIRDVGRRRPPRVRARAAG